MNFGRGLPMEQELPLFRYRHPRCCSLTARESWFCDHNLEILRSGRMHEENSGQQSGSRRCQLSERITPRTEDAALTLRQWPSCGEWRAGRQDPSACRERQRPDWISVAW